MADQVVIERRHIWPIIGGVIVVLLFGFLLWRSYHLEAEIRRLENRAGSFQQGPGAGLRRNRLRGLNQNPNQTPNNQAQPNQTTPPANPAPTAPQPAPQTQ